MAETSKKPLPAWVIRKVLDNQIVQKDEPGPSYAAPALFLAAAVLFFVWRFYA